MDRESLERIRTTTFTVARRGYDKREVDRFLTRLADWLESGGGDEERSQVVRDELTRIAEQTAKILTDAHEVAETLRSEGEMDATNVRSEADAYAERVRIEADEYSKEQRAEADAYVARARTEAQEETAEMRDTAERDSLQLAEEVARRRRGLDDEIQELEERREAVIEEMQRLSSQLAGTASEHLPPPEPATEPDFELGVSEEEELVELAGDEPLEAEEAEFEEYEDEVEDDAAAEASGETVEWDIESELEEEPPAR